jgi:hypothetical protein
MTMLDMGDGIESVVVHMLARSEDCKATEKGHRKRMNRFYSTVVERLQVPSSHHRKRAFDTKGMEKILS